MPTADMILIPLEHSCEMMQKQSVRDQKPLKVNYKISGIR